MTDNTNTFGTRSALEHGGESYTIYSLAKLAERQPNVTRLPFSLKVLLENLLRFEDGHQVDSEDIETLASWDPSRHPNHEIAFTVARVLLQDFTGVPAVVDLAAMRDAMVELGGDPALINPLVPADLVIDHSVQVDHYGSRNAVKLNTQIEFQRNRERYQLLRWAQEAFENFRAVPPGTGIVHQVNLEYLACSVFNKDGVLYPDTLVGTDSHTTMINGLGVVGWGVGGIEAEAALLGQPIAMLIPEVVGFKLHGKLPEGATATDLVLRVVELLRAKGVVGKFVEFFGPGLSSLSLPDRATIANMAPEYGATMGFFPVDEETLNYLRFSGRDPDHVELVGAYLREQGLFRTDETPDPVFVDTLSLDLATIEPALAGPKRPQDRVPLSKSKAMFADAAAKIIANEGRNPADELARTIAVRDGDQSYELHNGSVVIAAITSCTNTSNPSVIIGAGLLAKRALELGLTSKPWVKTSLAPGSKVVVRYLEQAGLLSSLESLGFHLVGFGCTTCIGNSGPLPEAVLRAIQEGDLLVTSVLSGNRNFEGRISPHIKANYLASPPLVVAYAIAGRMDIDLATEPLGQDKDGNDVFLKDVWPSSQEITDTVRTAVTSGQFTGEYASAFDGDENWQSLPVPEDSQTFDWVADSTYVRRPPFFEGMARTPAAPQDIHSARCLAKLGQSVTTDHISPAGSIALDSPAGRYLVAHGVERKLFNSYGSRRGNHEVMMRGTFANVRLRNELAPGTEGGWTTNLLTGAVESIYDAAMHYVQADIPLVILAGKEYGTGSSRDWAAKGTLLQGVKAVIVESFERIHRSNLIGMGVLPLQFQGASHESLGLSGHETFDITGMAQGLVAGKTLHVKATAGNGKVTDFDVTCRLDTPAEVDYYLHGGILQYVLRNLAGTV